MTSFTYGPVELYLVGFEGETPSPGTLGALGDLLDTGLVRLLDFVLVTKSADGEVDVVEVEDDTAALGLGGAVLLAAGLVGEEDVARFAEQMEPGSSAALVALELAFQRALAENLASSGGIVLDSQRIPAPIVNALLDFAEQEEGE